MGFKATYSEAQATEEGAGGSCTTIGALHAAVEAAPTPDKTAHIVWVGRMWGMDWVEAPPMPWIMSGIKAATQKPRNRVEQLQQSCVASMMVSNAPLVLC